MSVTRRREKAARRRAEAEARQRDRQLMETMSDAHAALHPYCTYGRAPHFVGPSFGQRGFFMCEADEAKRLGVDLDLTNHNRCPVPYDHEHIDHFGPEMVKIILDARMASAARREHERKMGQGVE